MLKKVRTKSGSVPYSASALKVKGVYSEQRPNLHLSFVKIRYKVFCNPVENITSLVEAIVIFLESCTCSTVLFESLHFPVPIMDR